MDICVVIPCFNHARTLRRAVESALGQPYVVSVVVVDDASTDETAACAEQLRARDSRVYLCSLSHNMGPGAARNRGVAISDSTHIAFLDADDELANDFFLSAKSFFDQTPTLLVAKCDMEFLDPVKGYVLPPEDPRYSAAVLSSSCGMLIRRDAFLRVGGFPEDAIFRGPAGGEDVAFMRAVMDFCQPLAKVPIVGYRVWSRAGSHVDRFLASTRLTSAGGFEFIRHPTAQASADELHDAVQAYLASAKTLGRF